MTIGLAYFKLQQFNSEETDYTLGNRSENGNLNCQSYLIKLMTNKMADFFKFKYKFMLSHKTTCLLSYFH